MNATSLSPVGRTTCLHQKLRPSAGQPSSLRPCQALPHQPSTCPNHPLLSQETQAGHTCPRSAPIEWIDRLPSLVTMPPFLPSITALSSENPALSSSQAPPRGAATFPACPAMPQHAGQLLPGDSQVCNWCQAGSQISLQGRKCASPTPSFT